jgi:hypothetical protein
MPVLIRAFRALGNFPGTPGFADNSIKVRNSKCYTTEYDASIPG